MHFSYEMVALSPRTCIEMGIELSDEDKKRPYVEVSGRKGLGVKADDLIDKLIEKALEEVTSRHAEDPEAQRRQVATKIAVGALRYFMLKYTRNSVIAFDFAEALSFTGETGVYVQYAAVRAGKILGKLTERGETLPDFRAELTPRSHRPAACGRRTVASRPDGVESGCGHRAGGDQRRAGACGALRLPARAGVQHVLSGFPGGHAKPITEKKTFLLWLTTYFRAQLEHTLGVLGIDVPEYM